MLILLTLVYFLSSCVYGEWTFLSGSKEVDSFSNYTEPHPGGIRHHTMGVYESAMYVFGGKGYNSNSVGSY